MNYLAIRTEMAASGRFDSTTEDTSMKRWVLSAYSQVWNAADWIFKKVGPTNLAVVSGTATPAMPSGYGKSLEVFDQNGEPLTALDSIEFDDIFRRSIAAGQTGPPQAYKVVNRVLTLGPTPNVTATFTISYERRLCVFLSDGVTVRVGPYANDTDLPFWYPQTEEFHMILVYGATIIGEMIQSDLASLVVQQQYQAELAAMIADLAVEDHGAESLQMGRDTLGLYL